jgi:hypothetical protein
MSGCWWWWFGCDIARTFIEGKAGDDEGWVVTWLRFTSGENCGRFPRGATIVTYRGRPYAAWTDGKGKAQRAPLNAAGNRIVQAAEGYTAQYFNEHGKRRKAPTACQDKAEALRYANHLENHARKRRTGEIDVAAERYGMEARRPLVEHLADFRQFLADKDNTAKHVRMICNHVRWLLDASEAKAVSDLTGPAVMRAVGQLRDDGASPRTCNAYLTSIKAFSRWLWEHKRTADG